MRIASLSASSTLLHANFRSRLSFANPAYPRFELLGFHQGLDRVEPSFKFLLTEDRVNLLVAGNANQNGDLPFAALWDKVMLRQFPAFVLVQANWAL